MSDNFNIVPEKLPSRQRNDTYLAILKKTAEALKDKPSGTAVRIEYPGHKANTLYQQCMRVRREQPTLAAIVDLSKRTVKGEQVCYAIRREH